MADGGRSIYRTMEVGKVPVIVAFYGLGCVASNEARQRNPCDQVRRRGKLGLSSMFPKQA